MSEVEIPATAIQIVADHCFGRPQTDDSVYFPEGEEAARDDAAAALDDAAPIIAAAAYRQVADRWTAEVGVPHSRATREQRVWLVAAKELRQRADELDPEGRTR